MAETATNFEKMTPREIGGRFHSSLEN